MHRSPSNFIYFKFLAIPLLIFAVFIAVIIWKLQDFLIEHISNNIWTISNRYSAQFALCDFLLFQAVRPVGHYLRTTWYIFFYCKLHTFTVGTTMLGKSGVMINSEILKVNSVFINGISQLISLSVTVRVTVDALGFPAVTGCQNGS